MVSIGFLKGIYRETYKEFIWISLRIQWDSVRCLFGFDGEFHMDSLRIQGNLEDLCGDSIKML